MKRRTHFPSVEPLESRIAPATLNVTGGIVTYTAGAGIANSLVLSISGGNYVFADSGETITLTAGAVNAGFTGGGTNTVQGPNAAVTSIGLGLGDQGDQLSIQGLTDPLNVDMGTGVDSIFVTNAINVGGALTLAAETVNVSGAVSGATTVLFAADTMAITASITASTKVTLQGFGTTRDISLGVETAGFLSLTNAELNFVTAPVLEIGVNVGGDIVVGGAVSLGATVSQVSLISSKTITDTAAGSLVGFHLRASSTDGVVLDSATNDLASISGTVTGTGDFTYTDADSIQVSTVNGVAGITVANGNVSISGLQITLNQPIAANTAGNTVRLAATAAILDGNGATNNITATNFSISAAGGIGTAVNPLEMSVSNVEARTATGGIFLANSGAVLNIGGVTASFEGVQATTSGDIQIVNNASIVVAGGSAERVRAASGNISIQASGATANIETRAGNVITALNGTLTVSAGQDLLLGSATTDQFGDLQSDQGMVLSAGRDIIIDENTDLLVLTAGSISATAGRNFSILASDGTSGSSIRTPGGTITIATGTGGIFTNTPGAGGGIFSNGNASAGADITISADLMGIAQAIHAGTAKVTLQPVNINTTVGLGAADAAGTLGLLDAEIDFVTAGLLRIGQPVGSPISITALINPANVSTLSLRSGTNIVASGAGAVQVANLAAVGNGVNLSAATNQISTIAGNAVGSFANAFGVTSAVALAVGTVDGVTGITTTSGGVTLTADNLAIGGAISSAGAVVLKAVSAARPTNLGTETGGALSVTTAELALVTAPTLRIGSAAAGVFTVSADFTRSTAMELISGSSIDVAATLTLGGATFTAPAVNVASGATLAAAGSATGAINVLPGGTLAPGTSPGLLMAASATMAATGVFSVELNGATAGTQHDQLSVTGTAALGGATLDLSLGFAPGANDELILIATGTGVTGTFAGLAEGAIVNVPSGKFTITYAGGDGNDVALNPIPLAVALSNGNKTATFTDVDGDLVTVKTTKGAFDGSEFFGVETGANGAGRLQKLLLDGDFKGANITITAKRTANGGNGFVNLGFLDATGVDLGTVTIAGDLARLAAGTVGGNAKVPAIKSLTVQSLGLLGSSTLASGDATFLGLQLEGGLPKLTVRDDLRASIEIHGATDGKLGAATINGSIVGMGGISADAGLGLLKVAGDIRAVGGNFTIASGGPIGAVTVGGSILGEDASKRVVIDGYGQLVAPTKGLNLALKSLTVKGTVAYALVTAGIGAVSNADAAIGSITVGGNWVASSAIAGAAVGTDTFFGTTDDTKNTGNNVAAIYSTISSFTVKGQAFGTGAAGDMFAVVAEHIGKAKVGTRTFAFKKLTQEGFYAAPTLGGAGVGNPTFDFIIRELGSPAANGTITGSPSPALSADHKTATFYDVDGDFITVKRSAGTFNNPDFFVAPTASGGGRFDKLTLSPAPDGKPYNVTITAKPGPDGGNGFVNVGEIFAFNHDIGNVIVGGELAILTSSDGDLARPGLASLTAHSLGNHSGFVLNSFMDYPNVNTRDGIGKITVARDVYAAIFADFGGLGSITIGGNLGSDPAAIVSGYILGDRFLGPVKIGGSVLPGSTIMTYGVMGAVTIGGNLTGSTIQVDGEDTVAGTKPDVVLKSLTVNGSLDTSSIFTGLKNADASIGTITVNHAWLASNVRAGVVAGSDGFLGTYDDAERPMASTNLPLRFSTIASITIKGQAFGSPTPGDNFGIVAQQIGKAKIGTLTFVFNPGEKDQADFYAIGPTGPGANNSLPGQLGSDFFIHEALL